MKKSDLISAMADKSGLTQKEAGNCLSALIEVVTESLKAGDKVQITGFGTFQTRSRDQRQGINPATKEKITIAASTSPAFKAGKAFKDAFK